jgi:hypothetical protein
MLHAASPACGKIRTLQATLELEIIITAAKLPLDNSFASLPPAFYTRLMPTPLPAPYLVASARRRPS